MNSDISLDYTRTWHPHMPNRQQPSPKRNLSGQGRTAELTFLILIYAAWRGFSESEGYRTGETVRTTALIGTFSPRDVSP